MTPLTESQVAEHLYEVWRNGDRCVGSIAAALMPLIRLCERATAEGINTGELYHVVGLMEDELAKLAGKEGTNA